MDADELIVTLVDLLADLQQFYDVTIYIEINPDGTCAVIKSDYEPSLIWAEDLKSLVIAMRQEIETLLRS